MDDILDQSLQIIYEKYIQKQTIRFVVDCAHEAFLKLIRMHFYQHSTIPQDIWRADIPIPPSPPDSWAYNQVPVYKNIPLKTTEIRVNTAVATENQLVKHDSTTDLSSEPSQTLISDVKVLVDNIIKNLPVTYETKSISVWFA